MPNQLSVKECISFGWRTFKMRPWFFVGTFVLYAVVQFVFSSIQKAMPGLLSLLLSSLVSTLFGIGLINVYLKAHANVTAPAFSDFWHPGPFWRYLGMSILLFIIVGIGLVLIIVPGIYAALAFGLAGYAVVDKGMNPIAALKESARLTKGNRWKLFLFALAVVGLSILAAIPLFLGLFVMAPVSMLAGIHAYRTLEGYAGATSAPAPASAA